MYDRGLHVVDTGEKFDVGNMTGTVTAEPEKTARDEAKELEDALKKIALMENQEKIQTIRKSHPTIRPPNPSTRSSCRATWLSLVGSDISGSCLWQISTCRCKWVPI